MAVILPLMLYPTTNSPSAHGIARGHCWDCGYKEYFSLTSIFSIGCKCSTNTRDRTRWEVKEFTQREYLTYTEPVLR